MSSCEVPAFVIGFRGESHESGRPPEELMAAYLKNQVKAKLISREESDKIKKAWMSHARWHNSSNEPVNHVYTGLVTESQI